VVLRALPWLHVALQQPTETEYLHGRWADGKKHIVHLREKSSSLVGDSAQENKKLFLSYMTWRDITMGAREIETSVSLVVRGVAKKDT
jgi:hypothetical protein